MAVQVDVGNQTTELLGRLLATTSARLELLEDSARAARRVRGDALPETNGKTEAAARVEPSAAVAPPRVPPRSELQPVSLTRGPVVLDLQALQSPDSAAAASPAMPTSSPSRSNGTIPSLVGGYLLNPDLPPPGDLGPLLGSAKVDYAGSPAAVRDGARLLHVLSPFELQVPIDRVWPRWAHEAGLAFLRDGL